MRLSTSIIPSSSPTGSISSLNKSPDELDSGLPSPTGTSPLGSDTNNHPIYDDCNTNSTDMIKNRTSVTSCEKPRGDPNVPNTYNQGRGLFIISQYWILAYTH